MPHITTPDPLLQHLAPLGAPQHAPRAVGLVSYQQSLGLSTALPDAAESAAATLRSTAQRRASLRLGRPGRRAGRSPRYRATLAKEEQTVELDSRWARLRRCQKRVHAWAQAIPMPNRVIRRKGAKVNIAPRMVMLTLTYRDAGAWQPNQIRDYMIALREHLGDRLLAYAWVLEMQERGAPHYHVLVYVKRGTDVPKPDATYWHYGLSRRETARTIFYICKYTAGAKHKEYQKEGFPIGARMFAVKIYQTDIPEEQLFLFTISSTPQWLQPYLIKAHNVLGSEVKYKRNAGGGWIICNTGEVLCSPWKLIALELVQ